MRIAKGPDPCPERFERFDRAWHLLKLTPETNKWKTSGFWTMVVQLRKAMASMTSMVERHAKASEVKHILKDYVHTVRNLNNIRKPLILQCTLYLHHLIEAVKQVGQPITKVIMGIMRRPFAKLLQGRRQVTDCSDAVLGVLDNLDDSTSITPDLLEEMRQSADDMSKVLGSLPKNVYYLNDFENMVYELTPPAAMRQGTTSEYGKKEQSLLEAIAEALDPSPPSQVQAQRKTNSLSAQYTFPQVQDFLKYVKNQCYCKHLLFKQAHDRDCTEN